MPISTAARILFVIGLASAAQPATALDAPGRFASPPVAGKTSSARLLSDAPGPDGAYLAGVEIGLAPRTVTYWRQPGDAGEPPKFDFSGSRNVASVETLYPAPKHIEEAGNLVAGYDSTVIFPLRVTAADKAQPVTLTLDLAYAACQALCLPARAHLALELPQSGASPFAGALSQALARAPRRLSLEETAAQIKISPRSGTLAWTLSYQGPGRLQDVFTEAPDPFFLDATRAEQGSDYILTLATNGAAAPSSVPTTLTLVTDLGALETRVELK
ncbi:MAG TPA: protein-disulfide reductase DsbD domain-containing protein [Methylocystis sp.]|nr:protein-disulfide reductase DsbD domain-containing protein [Methylocystis sp.]